MKLRDVYVMSRMAAAANLLFRLLGERQPEESISHRAMPTWEDHQRFVNSRPYLAWYIIHADGADAGACYLTNAGEIGIGILREFRGNGYAKAAITELMRLHPRQEYLANINPRNLVSLKLFESIGFKGPIQVTLRKESHA